MEPRERNQREHHRVKNEIAIRIAPNAKREASLRLPVGLSGNSRAIREEIELVGAKSDQLI